MNASQRRIFLVLTAMVVGLIASLYARSEPEGGTPITFRQKSPVVEPEPLRQTLLEQSVVLGGKAGGKVLPFAMNKDSLEASIRSHPMPEVWLTVPVYSASHESFGTEYDNATYKVQLPKKVMRKLTNTWKVARYFYYLELFGPQDSESRFKRDIDFKIFLHNTTVEIETTPIKTPDGRRSLSWEEAWDLVILMDDFAKNLLLQADETVRPKRRVV